LDLDARRSVTVRRSYRLDAVCEADPLQQKPGIRLNRNPDANFALFTGLFDDGDIQSTRPQGERSRQASNSAADDGDLKSLRHHLLLSPDFMKLPWTLWSSIQGAGGVCG